MRKFVARFNFPCSIIGNRLQSLPGHIVKVSQNYKNRQLLKYVRIKNNNLQGG